MASLYDTLQGVLNRAHRDHVYVRDQEKYDLREHWTVNLEGIAEIEWQYSDRSTGMPIRC